MKTEVRNTLILIVITLIIIALYFLLYTNEKPVFDPKETNFAVENTEQIRKITITQKIQGEKDKKVILTKKGNKWFVNGRQADKFRIEELLNAIKNIRVRERPKEIAEKNFLKFLKEAHLIVKIETANGTKEYYVGPSTPDGTGTIAMLKYAEHPYVVHIPGFAGTITPRYSPNEKDWIDLKIYPQDSVNKMTIVAGNDTLFYIETDKDVVKKYYNTNKTAKLPDVLNILKTGIYAENEIIKEKNEVADSLKGQKMLFKLIVSDANGRTSELHFYENKFSREHLYAVNPKDSTIYLVQKFVLIPLLGHKYLNI